MSDRTILNRSLCGVLRRLYLTSLGAAYIFRGHARRAADDDLRAQLIDYAKQMVARRDSVACLLLKSGSRRPLQRILWYPLAWLWGLVTAWTGPVFRLHMAANLEHNCGQMTVAALELARAAALKEVAEELIRIIRADKARREWLIERLRQAAAPAP